MPATNQQIQAFVDTRVRPHAEVARQIQVLYDDDIATIDDVYAALNGQNDWEDTRTDGPPHLMTGNDVLAINAFMHDIRDAIVGHPQYAIVKKACVRGPLG